MENPRPPELHAFTRSYSRISNEISSAVRVSNIATDKTENTFAIWDTGATHSVITRSMVEKLKLVQVSFAKVKGVHGIKDNIPVYGIRLSLDSIDFILDVTEYEELVDDGSHCILIGMDVINRGDFAISNFNKQTTITFRTPSVSKIDFVTETDIKY